MNCIIVEDDEMTRQLIRNLISKLDFLQIVAECEHPLQAMNVLKKEKVDLVLLDVCMPEMTGIEFLRITPSLLTILITSRKAYAIEAFEHHVVDYVVKPISKDRLMKAINRAQEIYESRQQKPNDNIDKDFISIKDKGMLIKINTSEILYMQALGDYVTIHTLKNKYIVRLQLKSAMDKLPASKFMRIHRSYIVAIDKVESMEENAVSINSNIIPVSEQYRSEFIKKLNIL